MLDTVFTDICFCMPAGISLLLFLAVVGGWGMKPCRRRRSGE